ncbi:hypothetical protein EIP86_008569 [Pleurotus ostreatoroseus]|nr:hypothetical protein EIP86_008569 [Pleurotus ostreatoroseus]
MVPLSQVMWLLALTTVARAVISPKVFIINFYNDEQNVWLGIPDFNLLEQNITLPNLSMLFPDIHCTVDGSVCQLITGEAEINAATSTTALVLAPQFNLTQTYFLLAGVAGINPKVGTIGSVAFAQFAVQVALQYEIDAQVFQLNDALRQKAIDFAKTATLNDSTSAQAYRQLYANQSDYAPALAGPSVLACDTATSDVWWSGDLLGAAFENTTRLLTNGSATYCTSQQEDNAVLESLLRGHVAGRVDFSRVIDMRIGSAFDRQGENMSVAENLFNGQSAGYDAGLLNIYLAGVKVVEGILQGWNTTFEQGVPAQNYIGDVFGSLGGTPSFGPGSIFNDSGAPAASQTVKQNTATSGAVMSVR